jgi:hypothetical protein
MCFTDFHDNGEQNRHMFLKLLSRIKKRPPERLFPEKPAQKAPYLSGGALDLLGPDPETAIRLLIQQELRTAKIDTLPQQLEEIKARCSEIERRMRENRDR